MEARLEERAGHKLWVAADEGPALGSYQSALDLIGDALGHQADAVVVPATRLDPGFLDLRTRMAGEFVQKVVNYQLRLAIVGDVQDAVVASDALRDYVREANRGRHVWFVADLDEVAARLGRL